MGYAYIYRLNTKIRLTMLCLSGFELYSRWVPLYVQPLVSINHRADIYMLAFAESSGRGTSPQCLRCGKELGL